MNRKIFIIFLLMIVVVVFGLVFFGLGSCFLSNETNEKNTLKNNLDWEPQPSLTTDQWTGEGSPLEGVYTGSYMTDSGNVLNVRIRLSKEQKFEANYQYADGSHNTININGQFQWDSTGSVIIVDVIDAPIKYKVGKNKLIRLDDSNFELEKVQ